ncbi:AsnC family transcriptional regulator [Halorutilales archaeon Cl-col2-1]
MRGIDDTDLKILDLLLEDARRPYSEIADEVGLSPPAVSDRIDRLKEIGVVRRFTVDLDRSLLDEGVRVLVDLYLEANADTRDAADVLRAFDETDDLYTTADSRVVFTATTSPERVSEIASSVEGIEDYEVSLLIDTASSPGVGDATLALSCDECGNTVTSEGESVTIDGDTYHFCCPSCESSFEERYERLREGA